MTTATSFAFFAMVGFEDSVHMAEETHDPSRIFSEITLTGLSITGVINMLMASRLLYEMAEQAVLPPVPRQGARRTTYAVGVDPAHDRDRVRPDHLGLEREREHRLRTRRHDVLAAAGGLHGRQRACPGAWQGSGGRGALPCPTALPVIGTITCAYLVTLLSGRDPQEYAVAGLLLVLGLVLWVITWFANRALRAQRTYFKDPSGLE